MGSPILSYVSITRARQIFSLSTSDFNTMMPSTSDKKEKRFGLTKMILLSGLLVGTLDILAAIVQTLLNGRNPLGMLKFIASGYFGTPALTGGFVYAICGLLFHYVIAMGWTVLFFWIYPK